MKMYALSGLGANELVFKKLVFPKDIQFFFLPWILPTENESIEMYARRIAEKIDDTEDFCLLGHSFGGIIAQEIARWKSPKKLILISTIVSDDEKPMWIRLNKYLKLYLHFPYTQFNNGPLLSIFSSLMRFLNPRRPHLGELYTMRHIAYTRWAFEQTVLWKRNYALNTETYRFHGCLDLLFPIWNLGSVRRILFAGHLAIYVAANEINKQFQDIL